MCWFVMPFWLDKYNYFLGSLFSNSLSRQLFDADSLLFYYSNITKPFKFGIFLFLSIIYYPILLKFSIFVILLTFRIYDYTSSYLRYITMRDWHIFNSKWYSDWILLRPFINRREQAILFYSKFIVFMLLTFDKHKNMDNKACRKGLSDFLNTFYGFSMSAFFVSYCLRLLFIFIFFILDTILKTFLKYLFKYISLYFLWLYFLWLYVLYLIFYNFKLNITNSISNSFWVLGIKLKNQFLIWLYLGWNYALVRAFLFFYPSVPHYYSPSTFLDYPLSYHPYFIKFFNNLKSFNLISFKVSYLFYYFSYLLNYLILFCYFLINLLRFIKFLPITFFMNIYKHFYRNSVVYLISNSLNYKLSFNGIVYFIFLSFGLIFFKNFILTLLLLVNFYFFFFWILSNIKFQGLNFVNLIFISFGFLNYFFFCSIFSSLRNIIRVILFLVFRIKYLLFFLLLYFIGFNFPMLCFFTYKIYFEFPISYFIDLLGYFDLWYWNDLWYWFFYSARANVIVSIENLIPIKKELFLFEKEYFAIYDTYFNTNNGKFRFWLFLKQLWAKPSITLNKFFITLPSNYLVYRIYLYHYNWWYDYKLVFYNTLFFYLWPLYLFFNLLKHSYFYFCIYLGLVWKYLVPMFFSINIINLCYSLSSLFFVIKYKIFTLYYLVFIKYLFIYLCQFIYKIDILVYNKMYLNFADFNFLMASFNFGIYYAYLTSLVYDFNLLINSAVLLLEDNLFKSYIKLDIFFYSILKSIFDLFFSYLRFPTYDVYWFLKFDTISAATIYARYILRS